MNDFTIAIYCFVDDYLQVAGEKAAAKRKRNDAEVITTSDGLPVDYFIVAGSVHDAKAFEAMHVVLPEGGSLYADSAYTKYELEDLYLECQQVSLLPRRRSNSKRGDTPAMEFIKQGIVI